MTVARGLVALPLTALLLAGCGTDPADERAAAVARLTEAANARDADGVRTRAQQLAAMLAAQRESGALPAADGDRLLALVERIRVGADMIDEALLERQRVEAERRKLEQERQRLADERKRAEQRNGKGKGKDDEEKDD